MSWREQLAKVDAVQKGRLFKVIASIVLAVAILPLALTMFPLSTVSATLAERLFHPSGFTCLPAA